MVKSVIAQAFAQPGRGDAGNLDTESINRWPVEANGHFCGSYYMSPISALPPHEEFLISKVAKQMKQL